MSIRVVDDGAGGYTLISPDAELVGWVRGAAVGVTGFPSEEAAVDAAVRAYRALLPWVERHGLKPLEPIGAGPMRIVHDGAHRWVAFGDIPVARLPGAIPHDRVEAAEHAFEIVLRGTPSDGVAIHAALIVQRVARGRTESAQIEWRPRAYAGLAPVTRLGAQER